MAYTIEVPVDWLRYGREVYIIEDEHVTGNPPAVYANRIEGFFPGGFLYRYTGGGTPQYREYFDAVCKTVFPNKTQAEKALRAMKRKKE